jgi:hypothetical protein
MSRIYFHTRMCVWWCCYHVWSCDLLFSVFSLSSAHDGFCCSEIILQKNVRCHTVVHGLLLLFLFWLSEIFHLLFTWLHYPIQGEWKTQRQTYRKCIYTTVQAESSFMNAGLLKHGCWVTASSGLTITCKVSTCCVRVVDLQLTSVSLLLPQWVQQGSRRSLCSKITSVFAFRLTWQTGEMAEYTSAKNGRITSDVSPRLIQ